MAVLISINGNSSGDGFLLAPLDSTYDAEISLWTDSGTETVTLQASPNPAGLVFSTVGPINLSTTPTSVSVHALTQSSSRGDTVLQVLSGAFLETSFNITSLRFPTINFRGRFEARFATDGAKYNANPIYTAVNDSVVPPGWAWALEGEPNFVPAVGNVPTRIDDTGVGRVIRLNNPISLRAHSDPVVSTVHSITGQTTTGSETFLVGDPLIGQPVNFGPDTYFSGNQPADPADGLPEEKHAAQVEPLALFKIDIGNPSLYFRGASEIGPYTHDSTFVGERTRVPDSRPFPTGITSAAAELTEFGLPDLNTFSATRIDQLIIDYNGLPAGPSVQRRNLARRIGHLLSSVTLAKRNAVQAANPGQFTVRTGTLAPGWTFKEVIIGKVDTDLHALSGGSSVVEYLRQFFSFDVEWSPFAFHTDELCGYHKGTLNGDSTMTGNSIGDPHTRTVDGTRYDFQSVGEFTLLRDGNNMEIQVRQSPVGTQNPITDSYSGLTSCVSIITAVAIRLGTHRISLQQAVREKEGLQFYLNGKPENLISTGLDLGGHRVTSFNASGRSGIRVVAEDNTVLVITPKFWNNQKVWYIDVNVSNTRAVEGLMGFIPKRSWLPRLRNGESVGPLPSSLAVRYHTLYKTFANSWRINNTNSLFVYSSGTSTDTFTDLDWPAEQTPCEIKPQFQIPGVPILEGMSIEKAKEICSAVTIDDLNAACIFDVASTGDKIFAEGYLFEQELRQCGTLVELSGHIPPTFSGRDETSDEPIKIAQNSLAVKAFVKPLFDSKLKPKGTVTFYLNNKQVGGPINLDANSEAKYKIDNIEKGNHKIRATFNPSDEKLCMPSHSSNFIHEVKKDLIEGDGLERKGCLGLAWRPWLIWILILMLLVILLWFSLK